MAFLYPLIKGIKVEEIKETPNYYAVIPARVRYADIMPNAKLLYGEITALSNSKGYCWSSNNHFAELYKVSEKQVSLWLKQLAEHKFVEIELIKSQSGTLRKVYLLEEKVIRVLRKGNVRNRGGTLPKGNTNNKLNIKTNTVIKKDFRGQESPAKERIRELLKDKQYKFL